jgi:tRNA modification GTPase
MPTTANPVVDSIDTMDTIAAISTPPGRGGIGIVRLSGPVALSLAQSLVRLAAPLTHAHARFGHILDPQGLPLDEALVTAFVAPHSYTGEDLVEIAAHGSPIILDAILHRALSLSTPGHLVRLAAPGEFTQRAFLAGRLDLTQAEAVHDLIAAQTLDQARSAAQQLGGALSRRIAPAKETLLHLIALLEAGMDFASGELDDVDVVPPTQIASSIHAAVTPLTELAASFTRGRLLRDGASIALIGPPNAGKSSLFNRLLDRPRSIVTATPGTTRDTIEDTLSLAGIPIRLIDTAGLRSSPHLDEAEQQGIMRTHEALADADLILLIHDATQPLTPDEQTLAATFTNRPHLYIENKIDLIDLPPQDLSSRPESSQPHREDAAERPAGRTHTPPTIHTSALTGQGLDTLRSAILIQLGGPNSIADTGSLNSLRQQQSITAAVSSLQTAAAANAATLPHELLLVDLHAALTALDSLTGTTTPDDILARIFSTFCIGK